MPNKRRFQTTQRARNAGRPYGRYRGGANNAPAPFNPRASLNNYNGPIFTGLDLSGKQVNTFVLLQSIISTTSGSPDTDDIVIGSSPANAPGWASYTGVFAEFRTLGFEIEFIPTNQYQTAVVVQMGARVIDRRTGTPLTSLNQAEGYESCRPTNFQQRWRQSAKMQNAEESQFSDVSTPTDLFWVKTWVQTSAIFQVGTYLVRYRVQFRTVSSV